MKKLLTMIGAMAIAICSHAAVDELGYTPMYWYRFLNGQVSLGSSNLTWKLPNATATPHKSFGEADLEGDKCAAICTVSGDNGLGYGMPVGVDWTIVLRGRMDDTDNSILFCLGYPIMNGNTGKSISITSSGRGLVSMSGRFGNNQHADLCTTNVADASSAFHLYALQYDSTREMISFWVDGLKCHEELDCPMTDASYGYFKFFGCYNGVPSNSGLVNGDASQTSAISDFRVYDRLLAAAELQALANPPTDEIGYRPAVWYSFDGDLDVESAAFLPSTSLTSTTASYTAGRTGSSDTAIRGASSVAGTGLKWGGSDYNGGNWTVLIDLKGENTANAAYFGTGSASVEGRIALTSAGASKVALSAYGKNADHVDKITVDVADASTAFHRYAIVRKGKDMSLWVDGVKGGEVERTSNPGDGGFAFLFSPGYMVQNGFVAATQSVMDDFRFYNRALTPQELLELSGVNDTVVTAYWTGAAGNGDLGDAGNWACTNSAGNAVSGALPSDATIVHFIGAVSVQIPSGAGFRCDSVCCDCSLSADCDWSGLAASSLDGLVDLAGNSLTLAGLSGSGTVTDGTGGGELHLAVPQGATITGTPLGTISLAGGLKLVKEGAGTYVASKAQTYSGGTEIAAGVARFGVDGTTYPFGASGSSITVARNAEIDTNGTNSQYPYPLTLAGGTLANRGSAMNMGIAGFAAVTLVDDSFVALTKSLSIQGAEQTTPTTLSLGGHTLTVEATNSVFRLYSCTATNGRIVLKGSNNPVLTLAQGVNASTVDFDITGDLAVYYVNSTVHDLVMRSGIRDSAVLGYAAVVTGTYVPYSAAFPNVVLASGSTLDLSGWDGPFVTEGAIGEKSVSLTFEPAATVTLDLGSRSTKQGDCIVSWTSAPQDVTISAVATEGRTVAIVKRETGVYRPNGFILIVQ